VTKVLEPILASPALPRSRQELREVLAREHLRRQRFQTELTEDRKRTLRRWLL
jgi:hypothetical protein